MAYIDSYKEAPKVSGKYRVITLNGKEGYCYYDIRYGGQWTDGNVTGVIKYWRNVNE